MEILNCRSGVLDSFGGTLNTGVGVYNANNQNQLAEALGAEIGGKILDALDGGVKGRPATASVGADRVATSQSSNIADADSASRVAVDRKSIPIKEAQTRLASLGYQVGTPNGVSGKRTVDAIKKFQAENQLPSSGSMDEATTVKLLQKSSALAVR
jgi:hypothetical protein